MSKKVEQAMKDVEKSEFVWLNDDHTTFQVTNAVTIWNNFRGVSDRYPNNHTKSFNLVVTKEFANELIDKKGDPSKKRFAVTEWPNKDEQGNPIPGEFIYFIKVNVNFNGLYPPAIALYTPLKNGMKRTSLDNDSVSILDTISAERTDVIVHGGISKDAGRKTLISYVNKLNVRQSAEEAQFGGYWEELVQEEDYEGNEYHGDEN